MSAARLLDGIAEVLRDEANLAEDFALNDLLVYLLADVLDALDRLSGVEA